MLCLIFDREWKEGGEDAWLGVSSLTWEWCPLCPLWGHSGTEMFWKVEEATGRTDGLFYFPWHLLKGRRCTFFLLEKSFMHRLYLQNDARYILGLLCCTRETQKCLSIFLPCCKQLGGRKCLNLNDRNKTRLKHMMLFLDPQRGPEEG